ncbi:MAG: T9SS type A sorting domain-containing protein [Ferruginibacter sp.]
MKNQILIPRPTKIFILLSLLLITSRASAATYTFTGAFGSNWSSSWSWPTGMPPNPIPAGDNVVLTATCNIDQPITSNGSISYAGNFPVNIYSSLSIGAGGSFTIANLTNYGTLTVNGTFVSNTVFTNNSNFIVNSSVNMTQPLRNYGYITINAAGRLTMQNAGSLLNNMNNNIYIAGQLHLNQVSLSNNGRVQVAPGGLINCISGGFVQSSYIIENAGSINIDNGCYLYNTGTFTNFSNGTIGGNGTFNHNWIYNGFSGSKFSPGNAGTGKLSVTGSSSANVPGSTTYECDINGTSMGVSHDWLSMAGFANLSNARLTVNWGSFIPVNGQSFTILTCAGRTGQFASVNIPPIPGRIFVVIYNPTSVVIQTTSIVPLRLLDFSGNITQSGQANLLWQTIHETNAAGYEIQDSDDGINFSKAGSVPAKNSTNIENYSFSIVQKKSKTFYRLKMMDRDGQFTYSNIIQLLFNSHQSFITVFPNPASNLLNLEYNTELGNVSVEITDMLGKPVISLQAGIADLKQIDISRLPAGTYTISLFNKNKRTISGKFIKK